MTALDLDFQRDAVLADLRARLRRCRHAKLTCTVLVEDGIFGIVRHPIYFAACLGIIGVCLLKITVFSLIVTPVGVLLYYLAAYYEDAYDEKKFGDAYREYRERTRMFIPLIY